MGGMGNGVGYDASGSGGGGGGGTVTSVGLIAPASVFNVSGSPVTVSGSLELSLATQAANRVWAGPLSGSPAVPTFRALVPADIPALPSNGWDLNGNTGTNPATNFIGTTDADLLIKSFNTVAIRMQANRVNIGGNDTNVNSSFGSVMIGGQASNINSGANFNAMINPFLCTITGASNTLINGEGSTIVGDKNIVLGSRLAVNAKTGVMMLGDFNGTLLTANNNDRLYTRFLGGQQHFVTPSLLATEITNAGTFRFLNSVGFSATPSITLGTGAGSGAMYSIGGSNQAGVITITVGTSPVAFGDLFELTLSDSYAYPNNAVLILSPVSTSAQTFVNDHTVTCTASTAKARAGVAAPAAAAVLQFQYFISGY